MKSEISKTTTSLRENIDGYWEDDGTVLLRRNIVEGLQVTQLQSKIGKIGKYVGAVTYQAGRQLWSRRHLHRRA